MKTVVTVDHESLARIRLDALETQEALIVEEQDKAPPPETPPKLHQDIFIDPVEQELTEEQNVWATLWEELSDIERKALAVILQGGDIKAFADEQGAMLEVLMEGINEKAMDCVGDNLCDDDFALYEDYIKQVEDLIL